MGFCTKFEPFETLEDAHASVFQYIETFYNRIHQVLGHLAPEQFEEKHAKN